MRDSVGEEEEPVHCLAWQKCVVPLNCFGGSGGNIIKGNKRLIVWLFDEAVLDVASLPINLIDSRVLL